MGGVILIEQTQSKEIPVIPHVRTIRKAREQVKIMVASGFSALQTKQYLKRWASWWSKTVEDWPMESLLKSFIESCWQMPLAAIAENLRQQIATSQNSCRPYDALGLNLDVAV